MESFTIVYYFHIYLYLTIAAIHIVMKTIQDKLTCNASNKIPNLHFNTLYELH